MRMGETFTEVLIQLLPRAFWSDKPSFNTVNNYWLARHIGLVGQGDEDTSRGVSVFAEFVWNFGLYSLPWALPLFFGLALMVDSMTARWIRSEGVRWFVRVALMFFFMQFGGMANAGTFILWSILVGKAVDLMVEYASSIRLPNPRLGGF